MWLLRYVSILFYLTLSRSHLTLVYRSVCLSVISADISLVPSPYLSPRNQHSIENSGLQFTCIALRRSQDDHNEELNTSFTKAYEQSLKKYHSFVVKPLFAVSFLITSWRSIRHACAYIYSMGPLTVPSTMPPSHFAIHTIIRIVTHISGLLTLSNQTYRLP